jgi:predicted PurR-regulated permease PerM
MADHRDIKRGLVGAIILSIFVLTFLILRPIIIPIVFGLLFAYISSPLYKKIYSKIRGKNISALILIAILILVVAAPILYITPILVNQIFETYVSVQNIDMGEVVGRLIKGDLSTSIAANIDNIIGQIFSSLLNQFKALLINLPSLLLQFAVFLFTFYFAIRDSDKLRGYMCTLSPFSDKTEEKFMKEFRGITNAIIFGQVLIGIIQGLVLGAGLFFLGVPRTLILTFTACIVSIIPILGSWIVWLPVGLYLLMIGQTFNGIFLLLYGALFVSVIDNLIRPYLLSKQSNLPVVLSVIGTIGGLYFFGIAGLVLGPLILAYALIIIEFYQKGKLKDLFNK